MNRQALLRTFSTLVVGGAVTLFAFETNKDLRENESERREQDMRDHVEAVFDQPALVTEQEIRGDDWAKAEVALGDGRICIAEYGIDQRDYGRFDRDNFEVSC